MRWHNSTPNRFAASLLWDTTREPEPEEVEPMRNAKAIALILATNQVSFRPDADSDKWEKIMVKSKLGQVDIALVGGQTVSVRATSSPGVFGVYAGTEELATIDAKAGKRAKDIIELKNGKVYTVPEFFSLARPRTVRSLRQDSHDRQPGESHHDTTRRARATPKRCVSRSTSWRPVVSN